MQFAYSLLTSFVVATGLAQWTQPTRDLRDCSGLAVSLQDAVAKALVARPGHVVEAELESGNDRPGANFYEIVIVAPDGIYEVVVDPRSGEVKENEKDDDEDAENELRFFTRVLRHCEKPLQDLVASAESVLRGRPVSAALGVSDGQPVCEIVFTNGRYVLEVEVEARAGHVVEIELEDTLPRSGDEDEDGDEDGDDDER